MHICNMTADFSISPAIIDDAQELAAVVNSAYRGESSKKGWTTEAELLDGERTNESQIRQIILQTDEIILKYSDRQGKILGCVYLQLKEAELYFGMLTVSPDLQAKGIGKLLLSAVEKYALQYHYNRITMTVISIRKELIAWYERRGYSATGECRPFPQNTEFGIQKRPLEFIVMEKQLSFK